MSKRSVVASRWAAATFERGRILVRRAATVAVAALPSLVVIAVLLFGSTAARADVYWSNTGSGDWSNAGNWGGNHVPTSAANAWIVNGGTATVTQLGPTCGTLMVGSSQGNGSLRVTDGGLSSSQQYVGYSGGGNVVQSGGNNSGLNNLYLGFTAGAVGTYTLSGTGTLSVPGDGTVSTTSGEYVGYSGSGNFTQIDTSQNNLQYQNLYLGYNAGSSGDYNLSGSGQLALHQLYVGCSGMGTFTQTAGTVRNTVTGSSLVLGFNQGGSGTYSLGGTAEIDLVDTNEFVGFSGIGNFAQSGGTNSLPYMNLYLGYKAGASGTYALIGGGQLLTDQEYVGYDPGATALFQQSGGNNATACIWIGKGGRYVLGGGTLNMFGAGGLLNQGVFDGGSGQGTWLIGSYSIVDLSQGTLQNAGRVAVSMGTNSLLIVPLGFNPSTGFKSYVSLGMTHTAGTTLLVQAGQGFGGAGSINDPVVCLGTITSNSNYNCINLNRGLVGSNSRSASLFGCWERS